MITSQSVTGGMMSSYFDKDDYYSNSVENENGDIVKEANENLNIFGNLNEDFKTRSELDAFIKSKTEKSEDVKRQPRAGFDFTFSAPKSVSIMSNIGTDEQREILRDAHQEAVNQTLKYIESNLAFVQKKVDGERILEKSEGIAAALFQHEMSREQDPELHTHAVILNYGKGQDGKPRSLDFGQILRNQKSLGVMYRASLQANIEKSGIMTISTDENHGFFELKGVDQNSIDHFSKRRDQIEAYMKEHGVNKEIANSKTRKSKDEMPIDKAREKWADESKQFKISTEKSTNNDKNNVIGLKEISILASQKLSDDKGIFSKTELMGEISKQIINDSDAVSNIKDIENHVNDNLKNLGLIKINDNTILSKEFHDNEKYIVDVMKSNKENQTECMNKINADTKLEEFGNNLFESKGYNLDTEQINAVKTILTTRDKIIGIQGVAGAGKTTALEALNDISKNNNIKVIGMAVSGKAADGLQIESGIDSGTVHKFLKDFKDNKIQKVADGKGIIVIDESSLLNINQTKEIIEASEKINYKVAMIGDTKQLQSVGAGKAFNSLQSNGMNTDTLENIRRQKNSNLLKAVTEASKGNTKEAFNQLNKNGHVVEISNKRERQKSIVNDYMKSTKAGKDTLIVTGKNVDRNQINKEIHFQKKSSGDFGKENNYDVSDKSKTNMDATKNISLAVGDKIIFTQNEYKELNVKNGQFGEITKISGLFKNKLTVKTNDREVTFNIKNYNNIDYGYATTPIKAQGMTVDKVIYEAKAKQSMTNKNEFYVGISRACDEAVIYTDSIENVQKKIDQEQQKASIFDAKIQDQLKAINETNIPEKREVEQKQAEPDAKKQFSESVNDSQKQKEMDGTDLKKQFSESVNDHIHIMNNDHDVMSDFHGYEEMMQQHDSMSDHNQNEFNHGHDSMSDFHGYEEMMQQHDSMSDHGLNFEKTQKLDQSEKIEKVEKAALDEHIEQKQVRNDEHERSLSLSLTK